jgi:hypothetical protein
MPEGKLRAIDPKTNPATKNSCSIPLTVPGGKHSQEPNPVTRVQLVDAATTNSPGLRSFSSSSLIH